ncbi:MAG: hypothetical protein ABEJ84_03925 [Halodesulfurarchaeum sp.]
MALVSLLVQAWHVLGEKSMSISQILLGVLFPAVIALLLLGEGMWFHYREFDAEEMLRLGSWVGMGFLVFA